MDKLPTFWTVKADIHISKELTTSRGPGTSFEFSIALVDQLFGESVARDIGELLVRNLCITLFHFDLCLFIESAF